MSSKAEIAMKPRAEYSIQLIDEVCARVSVGSSASAACTELSLSPRTFHGWLAVHPEAMARYKAARLCRGEHYRDKLDELNAKLEAGSIDPQSARVLSENLKKMAAWDAPSLFSEKASLEVTGKDGKDSHTARISNGPSRAGPLHGHDFRQGAEAARSQR